MCRNCKIIRRKGVVRVICTDPRHKAASRLNKRLETWHALLASTFRRTARRDRPDAIYGIGRTRAERSATRSASPYSKKIKDLTDGDLEKIREEIGKFTIEGDLRREMTMNIKRLMDLGCYRGFRHRRGLPVRGQRTQAPMRAPARSRKPRAP